MPSSAAPACPRSRLLLTLLVLAVIAVGLAAPRLDRLVMQGAEAIFGSQGAVEVNEELARTNEAMAKVIRDAGLQLPEVTTA